MSDIFDLLGDAKKPKKDTSSSADDDLDFLGGFKKKVTSGEVKSKRDTEKDAGMSLTIDIAELPAGQKDVMMMMMRDRLAKTKGLSITEIADRLDIPNLEAVLQALVDGNWLSLRGDKYRIVFRKKKGRLDNILSALED